MIDKVFFVLYFAAVCVIVGCGSGGLPGGDQTINVSTTQDQNQENNQNQNQPELECSHACTTEVDGGSNLTATCKGSGTEVIAVFSTFGDCAAELTSDESINAE